MRRWCGSLLGGLLLVAVVSHDGIADAAVGSRMGTSVIHVDDDAASGGNGSAARPFTSVYDAIDFARQQAPPRLVKLAPGSYPIDRTLVIDFDVHVRGSQRMMIDADGWPTGAAPGTETRITAAPTHGTAVLVKIGDGAIGAPLLNDVSVQDLTLEGGQSAYDVQFLKTKSFVARGNVVRGGSIGIFANASSGRIVGNLMTGMAACGSCLGGGSAASPSVIEFIGNRSIRNGAGGVLVNGGAPWVGDPDADHLDVTIRGNDVSDNTNFAGFPADNYTGQPGFGIRIFTIRRDNGAMGDAQFQGHVKAHVQGNRLHGNRVALLVDAGFPYRQYGNPVKCDERVYTGTVDLTLQGNSIEGSLLSPAWVLFTRVFARPRQPAQWGYLHGARFEITDPEGSIAGFPFHHPEHDTWVDGVCPADAAAEPLDNMLIYNGAVIPNGTGSLP